jgi:hypothetical protein
MFEFQSHGQKDERLPSPKKKEKKKKKEEKAMANKEKSRNTLLHESQRKHSDIRDVREWIGQCIQRGVDKHMKVYREGNM